MTPVPIPNTVVKLLPPMILLSGKVGRRRRLWIPTGSTRRDPFFFWRLQGGMSRCLVAASGGQVGLSRLPGLDRSPRLSVCAQPNVRGLPCRYRARGGSQVRTSTFTAMVFDSLLSGGSTGTAADDAVASPPPQIHAPGQERARPGHADPPPRGSLRAAVQAKRRAPVG